MILCMPDECLAILFTKTYCRVYQGMLGAVKFIKSNLNEIIFIRHYNLLDFPDVKIRNLKMRCYVLGACFVQGYRNQQELRNRIFQ